MKISKNFGEKVSQSVKSCHVTLVKSTIELLKMIGVKEGDDAVFNNTILLTDTAGNKITVNMVDRICYADRGDDSYYHLFFDDKNITSSFYMSLDQLEYIYSEVRSIVKAY